MIDINISDRPLDVQACIEAATNATCGGMAVFIGAVRNKTGKKNVVQLEYECYESMALKELRKIAGECMSRWKISDIVIHHRIGILKTGDIAVIIVTNAMHRDPSFDACRYAIDTLKKTVPIWKKEVYEDGAEWVFAHP